MANTGIWIDAPERTPLPHRLTAVVPVTEADEKSAFGINFEVVEPEATPYPHEVCATPSELVTAKNFDGIDYVQTAADGSPLTVTLYAGIECGFREWEAHAPKARQKLERGESHALETFLRSDVFPTGTAIATTATTLVGKFAQAEWEALKVYQAELLVHVSPVVAALLRDAKVIEMRDGALRTVSGSRVVIGTGYTATTAPAGGTASAAGEEWVFFTGAIEILAGGFHSHVGATPETNTHRALAERIYSVAIDGPLVGVLLDLEA